MPVLDRHRARVNESAAMFGLEPTPAMEELVQLSLQKLAWFGAEVAIYYSDTQRKPDDWRNYDDRQTLDRCRS